MKVLTQKNIMSMFLEVMLTKLFVLITSYMTMISKLVNNLVDKGFKYLVEELDTENLKILKQKSSYPYEYMKVLKDLMKINYVLESIFIVQQKIKKLVKMVKYQMVM